MTRACGKPSPDQTPTEALGRPTQLNEYNVYTPHFLRFFPIVFSFSKNDFPDNFALALSRIGLTVNGRLDLRAEKYYDRLMTMPR